MPEYRYKEILLLCQIIHTGHLVFGEFQLELSTSYSDYLLRLPLRTPYIAELCG